MKICARTRIPAILLGISLIFAFSAGAALAQEKASDAPAAATAIDSKPSASSYKDSLDKLSALYQADVQRLEKQNAQAKDLYAQGLISRVEMEKTDKDLADARAKVKEVAKQIADANKPAPVVTDAAVAPFAGNQSWSTGNARVDGLIRYNANLNRLDPYLVYCLMSQESKFASSATSPKGAMGLMQLMPGTATRYGVTNPYDMAQSIMGGTRYLKDLLKMFNGRVDLALAGYNAGEGAVIKYGYTIPPYDETRNYVKLIIKRYGRITTNEPKTKS
ncbi:MAG TPA: transglycosylase SLT domain-containing protein [Pyrinomonadaceae bacterium]|jgi:soluble lytic murein transglycosylase-like protein|nr:transglycosylase SLT domain-containing protein [Pyrinomonadaceae bacterium]